MVEVNQHLFKKSKIDSSKNEVVTTKIVVKPELKEVDKVKPKIKEIKKDSSIVYYIVKKGDTLYSLAKNNKTTVEQLCIINNIENYNIKIGQKIKIN